MENLHTDYDTYLDYMFSSAKSEYQREAKAMVENMRLETISIVEKIKSESEKKIDVAREKVNAANKKLEELKAQFKADAIQAEKVYKKHLEEVEANYNMQLNALREQSAKQLEKKEEALNAERKKSSAKLSDLQQKASKESSSMAAEYKQQIADLEQKILCMHKDAEILSKKKDAEIQAVRSQAFDSMKEYEQKAALLHSSDTAALKKEIRDKEQEIVKVRQEAQAAIAAEKNKCRREIDEARRQTNRSLEEKDRMHEEYVITAKQIIQTLQTANSQLQNNDLSRLSFFDKLKILFK